MRGFSGTFPGTGSERWFGPPHRRSGLRMRRSGIIQTVTAAVIASAMLAASEPGVRPAAGASAVGARTVHVDERGVHYVGKLKVRRNLQATTTLGVARAALGRPSSEVSLAADDLCRVRWRLLGISADFRRSEHVGGDLPCERAFYFDRARLGSGWKTRDGLKVGASTSRIRQIYPAARYVNGKWELVTADLPFSEGRQWLLAALSRAGRVTGLIATVGELD